MGLKRILLVLALVICAGKTHSQVVINEIMALNNGSVFSPNGDNPDYIELYNTSSSPVNLFGYTLTDNTNSPNKFVFPQGAVIPPNGYVIVWLDSDTNNPIDFHATFNLNASEGEEVALYRYGVRVDYVKFGFQIADKPICRIPNGTGIWKLGMPTPYTENVAVSLGNPIYLKINEWMATNSKGSDWIEIYNPRTNGPVDMSLMYFTSTKMDGTSNLATSVIPPLSFINSNAFLLLWCDKAPEKGANHLDLALSSTYGETTSMYLSNRVTLVDRVVFGPQIRDISMGRLPDGSTNIVYFPAGRSTPEASNFLPITNLVVNELLAHTDPPLEDAVEFYNPTPDPVDISGYWLSDDEDFPQKYRIPANTIVPPFGYKVFYEYQFNVGQNAFTFNSAHGGEVCLFSAAADGSLTGYRIVKDFVATENGVSLGRYVKSTGGTDFVPMSKLSFTTNPLYYVSKDDPPSYIGIFRLGTGAPNPYPLVGPIIISEIMYHPPDIGTNDNPYDEYIELCNITTNSFPLYSTATNAPAQYTNTWHIRGEVDFDFPQGIVLPPNGKVLVVNFDPATNTAQLISFCQKYGIATNTPMFGPYKGKLSNRTGTIELYKPDPVQMPPHPDAGYVPYIFVEKVKYEDRNPWPTNADGGGYSLHRFSYTGYANDVTNWFSGPPTPGSDFLPPVIIAQPSSQTVSVGETATFSVSASGTAPRYQWFFNGALLINATNPVLTIQNATTNHTGSYWVVVTNELSSVTSAVATLTVSTSVKPEFAMPILQSNNTIKLTLKGTPGQVYSIDVSTSLVDWVSIMIITNTDTTISITDSTTNSPKKFYRSRLVQ
ncbi:MAG: lamin tail domain-containing protein [Verrucomicrobiia bacterium]|jgi:hypothetical protein